MTRPRFVITSFLVLSATLGSPASQLEGQIPLNLGFEQPAVEGFSRPWGWTLRSAADGATFHVDSLVRRSGTRSLRVSRSPEDLVGADEGRAHVLQHWIAPRFAWGDQVRLTGWVRSEDLRGRGHLVLEAWGNGILATDSAFIEEVTRGSWVRLELSILVDSTAHSVFVTAGLQGGGTVWFDDLSIEARGRAWDSVPAADPADASTLEWLRGRSTAFERTEVRPAGQDSFADLEAFAAIVGDARIVALGESTHGTAEFFRAKHRLLAYLVEQHGFRVFAIEANQMAVEPINEYVRGGSGDARSLMRAMFAVWNTEEVRSLIDWIRAYNARQPERMVEFVGFDMQDPRVPIDSVSAFLGRVQPTLRSWADSLYAPYRGAWRAAQYPQDSEAARQSWYDSADEVFRRVLTHQDEWLEATDVDHAGVEWVVQNANVVRQAALSALTGDFATRDSAMAENVRWALDRRPPGTRIVVWAHDGHISRAEHEWANYWGGGSMGGALSRAFGEDYRAFGLLTHQGSYSGWLGQEIIDTRLLPAPEGSLENALHKVAQQLGTKLLITDIRHAGDEAGGQWLLAPRPIRMIGYAAEDLGFATDISVGHQFDGVVFIDRTTRSQVLRRRQRPD